MNKARRLALPVLCVIAICGLGGIIAFRFGGVADRKELEKQMVRAKRLGMPFTPEEVWGPKIPEERNAAVLYTQLVGREPEMNRAKGELKSLDPINDRAKIAAILAKTRPDLALFEAATARPDCRFERGSGWNVTFKELGAMQAAANLLAARSEQENLAGNPEAAFATLDLIASAAAHAGREPVLIAKLSQAGLEAIAIRGAQKILSAHGRRPEIRAAARTMLKRLGPAPTIKESIRGEWYFQRAVLKELDEGKVDSGNVYSEEGNESRQFNFILRTPALRARQELVMVRTVLDLYEALPDDPGKVGEAMDTMASVDAKISSGTFDYTLANLFMPVYTGAPVGAGRSIASRRALSALLNALDSPTPPKKLPASGDDAIDPFDGMPLRYRANRKEIRIWSIGPDKKDDGGLLRRTNDAEDITVVWTPAP